MAPEVKRFEVNFKNQQATFRGGDVVSGNIELVLGQELKVKGMRMVLHGIARVHWDERKTYTKGSATKLSHKNMDVYLDESMFIMTKTDGSSMAAGRYEYPFTFRLPPYLPSSYEGHWGRVQYWAKVILQRSWKGDIDTTKAFTVQGILDLNHETDSKKPVQNQGEAMVGTMCCVSGPVAASLRIPKKGYVSGDNINFTALLENKSKRRLSSLRVVLSQQVTFRADKQVRKTHQVIKAVGKTNIAAGEKLEWEDEIKTIPQVVPSRLGGGCRNIEVKYFITLIVTPSGPSKDLEIPIEVIMGTVPYRRASSVTPMLTVKAAARRKSSITAIPEGLVVPGKDNVTKNNETEEDKKLANSKTKG